MRQTFILPTDRNSAFKMVQDGLGDIKNVTTVHDINELSAALQPVKDEEKIVVIDFNWDQGYELAIQNCAKDPMARREFINKTPVICISSYAASSTRRAMMDQLGVVGFVSVKDSFPNYGAGKTTSRLREILAELQKRDGKITPQVFNEVVANLPEPTPKRRGLRLG